MTEQKMDADWLEFHPNPKVPDFKLPSGAVDAHCHVFGPSPEFPFAPERKHTPCNAGKAQLYALRYHPHKRIRTSNAQADLMSNFI